MKREKEYKCPVCECYTFEENGDYDICPVCGWENDYVQNTDPDFAGGANELSLNESRKNWRNSQDEY